MIFMYLIGVLGCNRKYFTCMLGGNWGAAKGKPTAICRKISQQPADGLDVIVTILVRGFHVKTLP